MKRRDLLKSLNEIANAASVDFELVRHGANHDIYRVGSVQLTVPRHAEIAELLAKSDRGLVAGRTAFDRGGAGAPSLAAPVP